MPGMTGMYGTPAGDMGAPQQPDALAQTAQMILMALLEERQRSEGAQQMDLISALSSGYGDQPWLGGGVESGDPYGGGGLSAGYGAQPWAAGGEDPDWMGMMSSLAGLFGGGGGL